MKTLVSTIILILLLTTPALAVTPLTTEQVKILLTDRTFQIRTQQGKGSQTYFSKDGRYVSVMSQTGRSSVKFTKNGSWTVLNQGVLCVKTLRHTTHRSRREETCGQIVKTGQKTFQRYDEKLKPHSTFTYIGQGNKLP